MKHTHLDLNKKEKQALVNEWKRLRYQREWSLRQAAKMIDMNPGYLSQIENGETMPGQSILIKIALTITNAKIKARQDLW